MKKINSIFLSILMMLFVAVSCNSPMDENPRYQEPTTFVLNTPAYADALYDLINTEKVVLTWSQPDYGMATAVDYTVQVSTDGDWTSDKVQEISEKSNLCVTSISARELDVLICQALGVLGEADMPTDPIKVYIRVKANIPSIEAGSSLKSEIYSNTITLNNVLAYYALPDGELPTAMYMIGNFCEWNWTNAAKMIAIHSNPDRFWVIRYVKAGEGFKFSSEPSWSGKDFGYNTSGVTIGSNVAGDVAADADGNFTVSKSGWYIFSVSTSIVGRDYNYTVDILAPNVYVYGAANGGTWGNDDAWKFEVIDDPDAEWPFVSPTLLATDGTEDSCLRLCIHPTEWSSIDWWRTEFIFFEGKISYRGVGNDQTRVGNAAGKVYLNFVTGNAKVE